MNRGVCSLMPLLMACAAFADAGTPISEADFAKESAAAWEALHTFRPLNLPRVRFKKAIQEMAALWKVKIDVREEALREVGVDLDAEMPLTYRSVSLEAALEMAIEMGHGRLVGGLARPFAIIVNGTITVDTCENHLKMRRTVVYDVSMLLPADDPAGKKAREEALTAILQMYAPIVAGELKPSNSLAIADGRMTVLTDMGRHELIRAALACLRGAPGVPADPAMRRAAEAAQKAKDLLKTVLPKLAFRDEPLVKAVQALGAAVKADMFLDWPSIAAAGYDTERLVTFDASGKTLEAALAAAFHDPAFKEKPEHLPAWMVENGIIRVSTGEWKMAIGDIVHYDISRIAKTPADIERLKKRIVETDPESFGDGPDFPAKIASWPGRLVIRQSLAGHERIAALLSGLEPVK